MSHYIIHDAGGNIDRVLDVPANEINQQLKPGEHALPGKAEPTDKIDVKSKKIIKVPPQLKVAQPWPEFSQQRQRLYPPIAEQLDLLWHAMDAGEIPKAIGFYNRLKTVKDAVPKGDTDITFVYSSEPIPENK